jgi:Ca2+-binding EF-hand superfamily protein
MKRELGSTILRFGVSLFTCCLLTNSIALRAQELTSALPPGGPNQIHAVEFGISINGVDIATILLKACDLDQNGKVTLAELEGVTVAYFKFWDTNTDGSLSGNELSTALKQLFPAPPPGGLHAVRVVNGVAVEISPDELPTPDAQVAKNILAGSDFNTDGALTYQEVSAFLLGRCFRQWDQDGNGSLDAQELHVAFGQLARPD